jgi:hypothetical protein
VAKDLAAPCATQHYGHWVTSPRLQVRRFFLFFSPAPLARTPAADLRDLPSQDIFWLCSCRGIRYPAREIIVQPHFGAPLQKMSARGEMAECQGLSETVATQDFDISWTGCNIRCRGLYLHLRRRPMGRTHAPPHLPGGTDRLYGGKATELALALVPVGLAHHRHRTKCQVALEHLQPRGTFKKKGRVGRLFSRGIAFFWPIL